MMMFFFAWKITVHAKRELGGSEINGCGEWIGVTKPLIGGGEELAVEKRFEGEGRTNIEEENKKRIK